MARLRHRNVPRDDKVRNKTEAEMNEALFQAKDQAWNSAGDARLNHPGSNAGRL